MRLILFAASMAVAGAAAAHHSAAPHFDMEQVVELDGVVTDFQFVNPHAYVFFDVETDSGEVEQWRCELSSATSMKRRGWTAETLFPGQRLAVNGAPARREDNHCYTNFFTLEDGSVVSRQADLIESVSQPATTENTVERPVLLANGQPNLAGPWVSQGMGGGMGPGGPGGMAPGGFRPGAMGGFRTPPGFPEPTAAGALAAADYDQPFDDPAIFCHPANIIFGFTHDQHVNEIYQTDDTVTLQYGYMDLVRTIHLDQTVHPDTIVPSVGGHSIGRWEDDVLVVDTIGFEQGVLFPLSGLMHSADMHVIERFRVDTENETLIREFVASDPAFLQSEYRGENVLLLTDEPYVPYNCTELSGDNNRRPGR